MRVPIVTKCFRCGEEQQCQHIAAVPICQECLRRIVAEFVIRSREYAVLTQAQR